MSNFTPRVARFDGRRNHSKVKALTVLYLRQEQGLGKVSLRELAKLSAVSLAYLRRRIGKWHKWELVTQQPCSLTGFEYGIAAAGRRYLSQVPQDVATMLIEEIIAAREKQKTV